MAVHFLHTGTTGGTALDPALRAAIEEGRIVFHAHDVHLNELPSAQPAVFFIREPISRFVSGFNSRPHPGAPRYNSPPAADEATPSAHFNPPNLLAGPSSNA